VYRRARSLTDAHITQEHNCIHTHTHTHIHKHTQTYPQAHICTHKPTYAHMGPHINTAIHKSPVMYTQVHSCTPVHTHVDTHELVAAKSNMSLPACFWPGLSQPGLSPLPSSQGSFVGGKGRSQQLDPRPVCSSVPGRVAAGACTHM
jgi:hypothetical protein